LAKIVDVLETDLGTLFEDFKTGKKSPTDAEISSLNEAARRMGIEDLKVLRKVAERFVRTSFTR
jgi:hypothetical protein